MTKSTKTWIKLSEGKEIPCKIYIENRTNVRYSIGSTAAIIRLPAQLTKKVSSKYLEEFKEWVKEKFIADKSLQIRFFGKMYVDGDLLNINGHTFTLSIKYSDRQSHNAKLKDGVIYLSLANGDILHNLQKSVRQLLSRVCAGYFLPDFSKRVHEINKLHFQQRVNKITFKYTKTRWGSCTNTGNLNFSTRMLFAPKLAQDSIIIHELAHLIELNHSEKYWKLVYKSMPDYDVYEKWLKTNNNNCDF